MKHEQKQEGFVAIASAIVIASLLIIIGASLGYAGFFSRFNILDGELKEMSLGFAEACAEKGRVEIANNTIPFSGRTYADVPCQIISVTDNGGGSYTVRAQGSSQNSYSNIQAIFSRTSNDVIVTSWQEVPNF